MPTRLAVSLLSFHGVGHFRHRFEAPLWHPLPSVLTHALDTLLDLLQCALHMLKPSLYLPLASSIDISSKQRMALVPGVLLGEVLFLLSSEALVFLQAGRK